MSIMQKRAYWTLALTFFAFPFLAYSIETNEIAELYPTHIDHLKLSTNSFRVEYHSITDQPKFGVTIRGHYDPDPSRSIYIQGNKIDLDPAGHFETFVPIEDQNSQIVIETKNLSLEVQKEIFSLDYSNWEKIKDRKFIRKRWEWTFNANILAQAAFFGQTYVTTFNQLGPALRASALYNSIPNRLTFGLIGTFSTLSILSSTTDKASNSIISAFVGYTTDWVTLPWELTFHLEAFRFGVSSSSNPYIGAQGIVFPNFYPSIKYKKKDNESYWRGYVKASPLFNGLAILPGSFYYGGGVEYYWRWTKKYMMNITIDGSGLSSSLSDGRSLQFQTFNAGFGISY